MTIARITAWNRIKAMGIWDRMKFINTVHDDIQIDCENDPKLITAISECLEQVFIDLPKNFERVFKVPYNVPMAGEVSYGYDLKNLTEYKKDVDIVI